MAGKEDITVLERDASNACFDTYKDVPGARLVYADDCIYCTESVTLPMRRSQMRLAKFSVRVLLKAISEGSMGSFLMAAQVSRILFNKFFTDYSLCLFGSQRCHTIVLEVDISRLKRFLSRWVDSPNGAQYAIGIKIEGPPSHDRIKVSMLIF